MHQPQSQSSPSSAHQRPRWTIALTSVAFFMVSLDVLVVVTALPSSTVTWGLASRRYSGP
jgi:hypothetical protein